MRNQIISRMSILVCTLLSMVMTIFISACSITGGSQKSDPDKLKNVVVLETNYGTMKFELYPEDAPKTVRQIKRLVADGHYNGLLFYRVVKGHVIQAGGNGKNIPAVPLEISERKHIKGAVGLARSSEPGSGKSTIYICHIPRPHLDGKYAIFGQIIEGFGTLDTIANVEVKERFTNGVAFHRPIEPVKIIKAHLESLPRQN